MAMFRSLWDYRGFVRASVAREMRLRYTGSALGAMWQILAPLAMIAIYTVVFSSLMRSRLPGNEDPYGYTIFLCCAMLPWTMFTDILTRSQTMFIDNGNLLKKSTFPRSCVPAIVTGSALANFAIVYGVFLLLLALAGRWPGIVVIAAVIPLLVLGLLGLSIGVFLGVVHVFFRDVGHVLGIVLQGWFWLTPIVYPITALPHAYAQWFAVNPVTPIAQALQSIFVARAWPDWPSLAYPALLASVLMFISLAVFRRQSPWIVDEL